MADAPLPLSQAELPPERIAGYRIVRTLGAGGMASVYLGQDDDSGRQVALKVMAAHLAQDPAFQQRFLLEVKSTLGLKHPNVVEVLGYGETAGRWWMASELVDGGDVEGLLMKLGRLPVPAAVEIFAQLVEGLGAAHARGIIHRDVKPANLLLHRQGFVKIADFGIAKSVEGGSLTQTGTLVGTPAYMSPEQALGKPLDGRSDLFSAAVLLYELLTGVSPFLADSFGATVQKLFRGPERAAYDLCPQLPAAVEEVLEGLLSQERDHRPGDAAQVVAHLAAYRAEVAQRFPGLISQFVAQPEQAKAVILAHEAQYFLGRARGSLQKNEPKVAALALHRAHLLDPTEPSVNQLLAQLAEKEKLQFDAQPSPKLAEVETQLAATPDAAALLQQAAQLARLEGNLHKAVVHMKRYLRVKPGDGWMAGQLTSLTGERVSLRPLAARTQNLTQVASTADAARAAGRQGVARAPVQVQLVAPDGGGGSGSAEFVARYARVILFGGAAIVMVVGMALMARWIRSSGTEAAARGGGAARGDVILVPDGQDGDELRLGMMVSQARLAMRSGDSSTAVRSLRTIVTQWGDRPEGTWAELKLIGALVEADLPDEAVTVADRFLQRHPTSLARAEARLGRAAALAAKSEPGEAIDELTTLLRDHPESPLAPDALLTRGELRLLMGAGDEAIVDFTAAHGIGGTTKDQRKRAREGIVRAGGTPPEEEEEEAPSEEAPSDEAPADGAEGEVEE